MMETGLRVTAILALSIVLGLICNAVSPRRIAWITPPKAIPQPDAYVPLETARTLWSGGEAIFLDAREPADYEAGHIANAQNLPILAFDQHFGSVAPLLTPASQIVVYCDGTECELSHRLKERLGQMTFTNVQVLFNGWTAWKQAGLPTQQGAAP